MVREVVFAPPCKRFQCQHGTFLLELPERFRLPHVVAVGFLQSRVSGFDPAHVHGNVSAIVGVLVDGHFAPYPLSANPQRCFTFRFVFDPNSACRHHFLPWSCLFFYTLREAMGQLKKKEPRRAGLIGVLRAGYPPATVIR